MSAGRDSSPSSPRLEGSWKAALANEFNAPYMAELRSFLQAELDARRPIYPKGSEYFAALDATPLPDVRVVILGQDPYHGPGQAHGLCFSVREGVQPPPSLLNIFEEIRRDVGDGPRDGRLRDGNGCLLSWARQGVLLLNSVLTVQRGQAASHRGKGWETFTDAVVAAVNARCDNVVFLLWGSYAQKKAAGVDSDKHRVLTAPHPSPLSAHRGFFGCRHFSQANDFLVSRGLSAIDWFDVGA